MGIGSSVLALKTPYNLVMTLFSLYCFVTTAMWRFDSAFPGEAHGACQTSINYIMMLGGSEVGTFKTTAALFFWSKYIEWLDSIFLIFGDKSISVLHGKRFFFPFE
jgi:hypothetical protein